MNKLARFATGCGQMLWQTRPDKSAVFIGMAAPLDAYFCYAEGEAANDSVW